MSGNHSSMLFYGITKLFSEWLRIVVNDVRMNNIGPM